MEYLIADSNQGTERQAADADIRAKFSALDKLGISYKREEAKSKHNKALKLAILKVLHEESNKPLKSLFVPDHLLCMIKGDLMTEPVTIESGRTFEKSSILEAF